MKAFMTACAVLASSANADPQMISNLVNLGHTVSHPSLIHPYNGVPLNQVSFTNVNAYDMNYPLTTYTMARVPPYQLATLPITHQFIKREAEPESPYVIKTKMNNPVEGSQQEVQIKVDRSGKGQSFQHVEQKDAPQVMRDNYIMEHRRMAQRPLVSKMYIGAHRGMDINHQMERNQMGMNQMRMDRNQMVMDMNHMAMGRQDMEMYRNQQQRLEEQMMLQRKEQPNRDTMRVENMDQKNDQLLREMPVHGHPRQMDNTQQLGMNQMVQLINSNLKNAVESHSQTGKNMMNALESHEELGQNLRDAIELYESPVTMGSRRYSNMRDSMEINNHQNAGRNMMRVNQRINPQDQMIHTQQMRI